MAFNFKLFFHLAYRALFTTRGTNARLTPKRIVVILLLAVLYGAVEITNWLGFLLDSILFRKSWNQTIREPVFIVGVPRSGTTFLHRLLARDVEQFTAMTFWEILFAPSIIQKKFYNVIGAFDALCGSPLYRLIGALEKRSFKNLAKIHPISLFEAEEDGMILLHIFSSAFLAFALPFLDDLWPYILLDLKMEDAAQRGKIMAFYKRCVQNHLYVFGKEKRFLSKNPTFSTMVGMLSETFPDAKFICMVRSPLETVPSALSLLTFYFNTFLSPIEPCPFLDRHLEMISCYYRYPLNRLDRMSPDRRQVISYPALISCPAQTVDEIYTRFGFSISPCYDLIIQREDEKARTYQSSHEYSVKQFDLSRRQIVARYEDIFDRFGFEKT
jgi:omega-hydroxy-beta-dihydromenaquinone-9 sulfotransferase